MIWVAAWFFAGALGVWITAAVMSREYELDSEDTFFFLLIIVLGPIGLVTAFSILLAYGWGSISMSDHVINWVKRLPGVRR